MTAKNNSINVTDMLEQRSALRQAYKLIDSDPALQYCMLDTSADGQTLLVFCSSMHDPAHIEQSMKHVWQGNVEILDASMFVATA